MKRDVVFIIVAYKPKREEFRTLLAQLKEYVVIIIDNGATLTSDDIGRNQTLLSQTSNVGFAAGANIGIRHASGQGTRQWFIILNQDVNLSKESARVLIKAVQSLPPSVAGPFAGELDYNRWTTKLPGAKVQYISGSCIAIHEKVVSKVGYFTEQYFLYYEDVDYCIRATAFGFPVTRLDIPQVLHEDTKTFGAGSWKHQYYMARNHLLFVYTRAPLRVRWREALRLPKTMSEHIIRREKGALFGIGDYLFRRFGKLRKGNI